MVKAGVVQHVSGKFYVQSENGDIKILKVGDTIYQGDKVFGDPSNLTSHRLEILDDSGNTVVLVGLDNAIFDVSTVEKTFTNEEFSFAPVKLWSAKDEDVNLQAKADDTDITDEETAAGEEAGGVNSTDNGVFMYNQRDGLMVDASSSLRGNSLGRSDFNTPPFIDPLLQEGDETPIVLMAPSIPTIFVYDDKAPITGFISNGTVTDDDTPTISGQTDPNLKVDIFDNGTHLGSTNSDNSGDYTFTPTTPLDEGEHNIYVSVTGEDGTKVNSDTISFVVDVTAPDTPIVEITTDVNNDGFINADESNGKVDVKITVNNSTEIDDIIVVKDNFGHSYTITVTQEILNNGIIVTFPQPSEGEEIVVTATVQDPAGNISDEGRDSAKIDTSDLSLFGGISVEIVNDVDNNNLIGKDELGSNNTLTVEVTLQKLIVAGDKLIVTGTGNSDKEIILTQADIDKGTVQVDFQAPNNGVTFETTALAIDPAGNQSNLAKDWAKIDLTAPDAPTVEITTDINNDGFINAEESNGKIDVKITVSSNTEIGSVLTVSDNYGHTQNITVTESILNNGTTLSFPEPAEGKEIVIIATAKDPAGNISDEGRDSAIMDRSDLSLGLEVEIITDTNNDGYINKYELHNNTIEIKVTLSPNAVEGDTLSVTGTGNNTQIITLNSDHINNGFINLEFQAIEDGKTFITTALLEDPAGNRSNLATDSAKIDLTAPDAPIVEITTDINNDGFINA
ncbi:MAG: Ig-like domain-containing protein, partial [Arcobacteraceae bacterium]|nr:Ig-like domain-containing protein [Arcobacteraceae bacterium]